jgi:hypothetical protein
MKSFFGKLRRAVGTHSAEVKNQQDTEIRFPWLRILEVIKDSDKAGAIVLKVQKNLSAMRRETEQAAQRRETV